MSAFLVVACADHVGIGVDGGFMQANHGKAAPLRRIRPGDWIVCYSPSQAFGGKTPLRAFTALGVATGDEPVQADMGNGFHPWRRAVAWRRGRNTPILPLLDRLSFTAGRPHWGAKLRFGFLEIAEGDVAVIAEAMGIGLG